MRDRRTRLALALAAVGLVAVGAMFATGGSSNRSVAKVAVRSSDGDMSPALAKHLAQLSQTIPGKGGEPAGESAGTRLAARPPTWRSSPRWPIRRRTSRFRASRRRALRSRRPGRGLREPHRRAIRRSGSRSARRRRSTSPRRSALRARTCQPSSPWPGGRPIWRSTRTAGRITRRGRSAQCRMWITPGRRRRLAHRERARPEPEVEVPVRQLRHQRGRIDLDRPERPEREHALGRHGRGQHVR